MLNTVLITGANAGLGKETARQLALAGATRIVLACRNPQKAEAARLELEQSTGRSVFETLQLDVSDLQSVRAAVAALPGAVDSVLLNAGGLGGKTPGSTTSDGVTYTFAVNLLGHALLVEELLAAGKLKRAVVYSSIEAVRGIPMMRMARPALRTSSVDEFISVADGTWFGEAFDRTEAFILAKYTAGLWMGAASRQHPELRWITMSPGGSAGSTMSDAAPLVRFVATRLVQPLMKLTGRFHDLETGARRYLQALSDESLVSGVCYGSGYPGVTGPIVDQSTIFADIGDSAIQDNAGEAVQRLLAAAEASTGAGLGA